MSYNPLAAVDFPTQLVSAGSMTSTVLYTAAKAGLHRIAVYIDPATTGTLASVTATIGWTSNGIARSWTSSALSLANLNASNYISAMFPVFCDVGTNITVSTTVGGSAGSFNAHFGVKPPS